MSRKLFVLVRNDLQWSQRAVQAAHAVGRFCSQELRRTHPPRWDDETLVLLKVRNLQELEERFQECAEAWAFFEPDIGGQMTAFAVLDPPERFGNLPLL